jgi:hypothetical protein
VPSLGRIFGERLVRFLVRNLVMAVSDVVMVVVIIVTALDEARKLLDALEECVGGRYGTREEVMNRDEERNG